MMKFWMLILILSLGCGLVVGQESSNTANSVHTFQTFFRDATIAENLYGEGGLSFDNYEYGSGFRLVMQGGYPVLPQLEVGVGLGFSSFSPDQGSSQSGLTDLRVSGVYNLIQQPTNFSGGGYITLPLGDEKVGAGNLNFGGFGSVRHPVAPNLVITGTIGLDLMETKTVTSEFDPVTFQVKTSTETKYKSNLLLAGGGIYQLNPQLSLVGELNIWTEGDHMLLTGGGDFTLPMGSKLRGALGIGLDDGAPDFSILASFLHFLK